MSRKNQNWRRQHRLGVAISRLEQELAALQRSKAADQERVRTVEMHWTDRESLQKYVDGYNDRIWKLSQEIDRLSLRFHQYGIRR